MIYLIIHVKFRGGQKTRIRGLPWSCPLQNITKTMRKKNNHFEPLSWWCIANHPKTGHEHHKSPFLMKHEVLVKVQVNSEFRFQWSHWTKYPHLKCNRRSGEVLILVCKGNFTPNMHKSLDMLKFCQVYRCKKSSFGKALEKATHRSRNVPWDFFHPCRLWWIPSFFIEDIDIWYNWHNHKSEICPTSPKWKSFQPRWRQHFNRHLYASELQDWTAIQHY